MRANERSQAIKRALWGVLGLNLLVASAKLFVGWRIGAVALQADGVHSVLDASSNVVGLVGITLAARPPDTDHPYGHQRFETLAAMCIGLLIGASLIGILQRALAALRGSVAPPTVDRFAIATVVVTIAVNVLISRYEGRRGRELRSNILEADAGHTKSDAMAAVAVLVGFAGVEAGLPWADAAAALLVAGYLAKAAWMVLRANFSVLADRAVLDPAEVLRIALSVEGVKGAHKIRSRGSVDAVYLDLHIHLNPALVLQEAHEKTHQVVTRLRSEFPELADVLIHTEPADGRERGPSRLASAAPLAAASSALNRPE